MKKFKQFLLEAKLRGSKGITPETLSDIERDAQKELGIRVDNQTQAGQVAGSLMQKIEQSRKLTFEGLNQTQQRNIAEKLEELALQVIRSEYDNILDNVELNIKLVPFGEVANEMSELRDVPKEPKSKSEQRDIMDSGQKSEKKPDVDKRKSFLDRLLKKKEEKEEFVGSEEYKERVDKAKLINNIIQGEAKNTKKILHTDIVKDGLKDIFGEQKAKSIFKLYDQISKESDKLDWLIPIDIKAGMMRDGMEGMAGAVKIDWDDKGDDEEECESCAEDIMKGLEEGEDINDMQEGIGDLLSNGRPKITALGVDFPMLLHETVKGIYELIASAYLPSEQSDEEEIKKSKVVKMAVTSFEDEAEDLRYGSFIASRLRDFINKCKGVDRYPNMREFVFGRMVLLEAKDFLDLMTGILQNNEKYKIDIERMISEISEEIREYEISSIESDEDFSDESEYDEREEDTELEDLLRQTNDRESDVIDYSKMSRKEIQEIIDKALDEEDYETLDKIKPYIKESKSYRKRF